MTTPPGPAATQQEKLLQIVRRNRDTLYGREHDFEHIHTAEDFRARVPINSYDTLTPYIERMLRGERNILTADQPMMFATTSGTTGRSKLIRLRLVICTSTARGFTSTRFEFSLIFPTSRRRAIVSRPR